MSVFSVCQKKKKQTNITLTHNVAKNLNSGLALASGDLLCPGMAAETCIFSITETCVSRPFACVLQGMCSVLLRVMV